MRIRILNQIRMEMAPSSGSAAEVGTPREWDSDSESGVGTTGSYVAKLTRL